MRREFVGILLAVLVALPGLAPAVCPGPDCPCAQPVPEPPSSCCPEDGGCEDCVSCVNCGGQAPEPPALAPAGAQVVAARLASLATAPFGAPGASGPASDGACGPDGQSPPGRVSRHIPSIVLRV